MRQTKLKRTLIAEAELEPAGTAGVRAVPDWKCIIQTQRRRAQLRDEQAEADAPVVVVVPEIKVIGFGVNHTDVIEGRKSEEHTSELQSPCNLVCRLLLE